MTINIPWVYTLIPAAFTLAASIAGLYIMRKKNRFNGICVIGIGIVISLVLVPSFLMDNLEITKTGITHHTGMWFSQRVYGLEYSKTESIDIRIERGRKGRKLEIWYITNNLGKTERVDPGDLWEHNREIIVQKCVENGISVTQ